MSGPELVWLDLECSPAESARVPVAAETCLLSLARGLGSWTDCACLGSYKFWPSAECAAQLQFSHCLCCFALGTCYQLFASAGTFCLCDVTAWQIWLSVLAIADFCSRVDQVVLLFGVVSPDCVCLAGDPQWHDNFLLVDQVQIPMT